MANPSGVSRRLQQCIERLQANDYEGALVNLFPAIDKTAKKRRRKAGVGVRIRSFLKDEEVLITAVGMQVRGQVLRFAFLARQVWISKTQDLTPKPQYLWAHRDSDVSKAKEVMRVLGLENLKKVLHYLSMNYWGNFCGWPDLLIHNDDEIRFVEVKSRNDRLSEDQKNWFLGNHDHMGFNATIFKVGKA